MKQPAYSTKKRQLRRLVGKLQNLLANAANIDRQRVHKLLLRIRSLVQELIPVINPRDLKKILGATAVFLGGAFVNSLSAQQFASPQENPFGLVSTNYLAAVAFADLDADGDMDLLVGDVGGSLIYFKNNGTASAPQFGTPSVNPFGLVSTEGLSFPAFADLDADGDKDLVVGEYYGNMQYFKNTGTSTAPQFAAPVENPFGLSSTNYYAALPAFADLDNDGDLDLMAGEYGGSLQYFKNNGTASAPQFASPVENPFSLTTVNDISAPAFADLDKDGDMDLLVGEYDGALIYFKNSGTVSSPQFDPGTKNPFSLTSTYYNAFPAFADLDADGDQDLLVGEYYGSMQYYKNNAIVNAQARLSSDAIKLYPNPVVDVLTIHSKTPVEKLEILNATGQVVAVYNKPGEQVNLDIAAGVYTVKMTDVNGALSVGRVVKK